MNPLTQVKNLQKISAREVAAGISDEGSWHATYKDSAYIFIGGLPFDLTEGDILAVFAQYGEIVDVNLIRDKGTGKSKGFGFVAYADQRSTTLAVDNLNGAQVLGRTLRVDHVAKYKKKEQVDDDEEQRRREERGVCYQFQRGECSRGSSCKFSHDEQRNANTGWGPKEESDWKHDKYDKSSERKNMRRQDGRRRFEGNGADEDGRTKHNERRDDDDDDDGKNRYDDKRKRDRDDNGRNKYDERRRQRDDEGRRKDDVRRHRDDDIDVGRRKRDDDIDVGRRKRDYDDDDDGNDDDGRRNRMQRDDGNDDDDGRRRKRRDRDNDDDRRRKDDERGQRDAVGRSERRQRDDDRR